MNSNSTRNYRTRTTGIRILSAAGRRLWKSLCLALAFTFAGHYTLQAQATYANYQTNSVNGLCLLCGIVNPNNPINNVNLNDYSSYAITVGLLGVSVEQTLAFSAATTSAGNDSLIINIGADNPLLTAYLFTGLKVETYNGTIPNHDDQQVTPGILRLIDGNTRAEILLKPSASFDRVKLTLISEQVGALQGLRIYFAYHKPVIIPGLQPQSITVGDITKTYGDAAFEPGATASSGLVVSYASEDNTIAEPFQDAADGNKWKLRINKADTVLITVSQAGNGSYLPAPDKQFQLVIAPKPVTVGFSSTAVITKMYNGNTVGNIQASALSFATGDIINNDAVQVSPAFDAITYDNKNAGTGKTITLPIANLSLTGQKSFNYTIANTTALSFGNASITKAPLSIDADPQEKVFGENDPELTYTFSGLISGDDFSGSLARAAGTNVGVYAITQHTLTVSSNYDITFTGNNLTITKATQTISWAQPDIEIGCSALPAPVQLLASSSSNLPITYIVSNTGIAYVNGDILTPVAGGATTITATQPGDQNHEAATTMLKNFKYQLAGAIRQHWNDAIFFDNTAGNYVQWQWYRNGSPINGATMQYYNESAPLTGTFYVMATDKNGNIVQSCPVVAAGAGLAAGIKVSPIR